MEEISVYLLCRLAFALNQYLRFVQQLRPIPGRMRGLELVIVGLVGNKRGRSLLGSESKVKKNTEYS
jgi:hypothetical protein